jgi:hypothetical protein
MTQTMSRLKDLAAEAGPDGVAATVQSRFSEDVSAELPAFVAAAEPDTIVLRPGSADPGALSSGGAAQLVYVLRPLPASPVAAAARWVRSADGDAAVQVAAQLSVAGGFDLVLTPSGRPGASLAADLTKRGLASRAGAQTEGAIVTGFPRGLGRRARPGTATRRAPGRRGGHQRDKRRHGSVSGTGRYLTSLRTD